MHISRKPHLTLASCANSPLAIDLTCFSKLYIQGTHIEVWSMILIYTRLGSWKMVKSTLIPGFSNDIVAESYYVQGNRA
jgi:hypothetical protein